MLLSKPYDPFLYRLVIRPLSFKSRQGDCLKFHSQMPF